MKKVLVYQNRKIDDVIFDVSTPELEKIAKTKLFKILDKHWGVFDEWKTKLTKQKPIKCKACGHVNTYPLKT
jgi:hypothetical protein